MGLSERFLSYGTLLTLVCVFYAIYRRDPANELHERLLRVIKGLIQVETKQEIQVPPKVVIGYGGCVDLFVDGKELLPYHDEVGFPEHFEDISSFSELYKSFGYYFQHGAATERFIENVTLFDELTRYALTLPNTRYSVGGNAPTMALRLYAEGCDVTLAASLSSRYLSAIPQGIKVVGEPVSRDDIHLILEYKASDRWGPHTSPRANRYIAHHDVHNPRVSTLEALRKYTTVGSGSTQRADLFIVSGLQLMDSYHLSADYRLERLREIREQILSFPSSTKVHFEMASFSEESLINDLRELIIPLADSLGMNEQELNNLYSLYRYGNISHVSNSTPRVATVLDQMRYIYKSIRGLGKRLSRIHLHTLAFQVIMTGVGSDWRRSDIAAAKASLTAFRHVCHTSEVEAERATVLMDESFSLTTQPKDEVEWGGGRGGGEEGDDGGRRIRLEPEAPVPCWEEGEGEEGALGVCLAPGLVCKVALRTAGGGDNISAAAIAVQI